MTHNVLNVYIRYDILMNSIIIQSFFYICISYHYNAVRVGSDTQPTNIQFVFVCAKGFPHFALIRTHRHALSSFEQRQEKMPRCCNNPHYPCCLTLERVYLLKFSCDISSNVMMSILYIPLYFYDSIFARKTN